MSRRAVGLGAGLAVSAILLALVLRQVNLLRVIEVLREADCVHLLLAVVVMAFSYAARVWRWWLILRGVAEVRATNVLQAYVIGCMANNVLPVRVGELVRAVLVGRLEALGTSASLGTVVVERVFDVLLLLLFLVGGGLVTGTLASVERSMWFLGGAGGVALAGIYALARWGGRFLDVTAKLVDHVSVSLARWYRRVGQSFVTGLRAVHRPEAFAVILASSALAWLSVALMVHLALVAFGIRLPWSALVFALSVAGLGIAVPTSPGNVGTLEFLWVGALSLLGVDPSRALGYALAIHALDWTLVTVSGLAFLWQSGLSLVELRAVEREGPNPLGAAATGRK